MIQGKKEGKKKKVVERFTLFEQQIMFLVGTKVQGTDRSCGKPWFQGQGSRTGRASDKVRGLLVKCKVSAGAPSKGWNL